MTGSWPTGWAPGDVLTAAQLAKMMGAIYDTTLSGAVATIDVTGLLGSYAHLFIELDGRGDTAATNTGLNTRLNGDTGSNYDTQTLSGSAATATAQESLAQVTAGIGGIPASTAPANVFSGSLLWIPNYAKTDRQKMIYALGGFKVSTASGALTALIRACAWRSTSAVTQITFLPTAGNFVAGSRVTIYALGA